MKTKLILVRHGESEGNRTNTFTGFEDSALTDTGIKQAELLRDYLVNFEIDGIYSSDLSRAYNTALPLAKAKGLSVEKRSSLREINGGLWGGMPFSQIVDKYPEDFSVWKNDLGNAVCTGGESIAHLAERVHNEIKSIVRDNPGKTIVAVIHGTPIRTLICRWQGFEICDIVNVPWAANASVTTVLFSSAEEIPEITEFNYTDHLKDCVTSLPATI